MLLNTTRGKYDILNFFQFLKNFNTLYNLELDDSYLDEIIRKHDDMEKTLKNYNQCGKKNKSLIKS